MWTNNSAVLVVAVILAILEKGSALKCWQCRSDLDATCRDHFNTTRIFLDAKYQQTYTYPGQIVAQTNPHLVDCQGMHTITMAPVKNVCLKKVMSVPDVKGIYNLVVTRECKMIPSYLKAGRCPEDITEGDNTRYLQYCSTCEYDGCNSASRFKVVLTVVVPAALLILLHH